jgi:ABC-type nitrate/sulfonate/bicarbonate transport system substrate-binding protein
MTSEFSRRQFSKTALGLGAGAFGLAAGLPRNAAAADELTFQSIWLNDPEFLGYMIAIDKGYYAADGLKVNYLSGGPNLIPEGALLAGKADIALTNTVGLAIAVTQKGAPLKVIGTQFQKSPLGVISLESSNIKGPKDLIGKTVAAPPLSLAIFKACLAANDVPADKVKVVPFNFDPTPLATGNVDAVVDFVTELPFLVEQKGGKKSSYFLFYDFGLPLYIDLITVTEDTLKAKRKQLVAFLSASRKGWAENDANPDKYPKEYEQTWFKGNGSSVEAMAFHNKTQIPLMASPKGLFSMDEAGIKRNIDALAKVGINAPASMFDPSLLAEVK